LRQDAEEDAYAEAVADACDTYSRICEKCQGLQDADDEELDGENAYPDGECTCVLCEECQLMSKEEEVQTGRCPDCFKAERLSEDESDEADEQGPEPKRARK